MHIEQAVESFEFQWDRQVSYHALGDVTRRSPRKASTLFRAPSDTDHLLPSLNAEYSEV